jgi:hypothetical protein
MGSDGRLKHKRYMGMREHHPDQTYNVAHGLPSLGQNDSSFA